ncbi:MAG: hypothetical protein KJ737_24510, partial [Proteobacteria bacterium]|nr:hypothetical protein [Pseudomonadota bacterium]
ITLFSSGVSDLPCPMTMLLSAFPQKITLGAYYIQFSKCIKSFDRNYNQPINHSTFYTITNNHCLSLKKW